MNKNILQSLKSTRVFPEGYGKVYCLYNLLLIPRKSLVLKTTQSENIKKAKVGKLVILFASQQCDADNDGLNLMF